MKDNATKQARLKAAKTARRLVLKQARDLSSSSTHSWTTDHQNNANRVGGQPLCVEVVVSVALSLKELLLLPLTPSISLFITP